MQTRINILCTPDDNYVPYCGIMLTSLCENNKNTQIHVYLVCDSINKENRDNLNKLSEIYDIDLTIINVNKDIFNNCPIRVGDHVSIAAYYRILAPELLPHDIDKILYLDCDIIVNGSLTELYNTNISKYAFGAIIDEAYFNEAKYTRLCYDKKYSYINSGVLLINLEFWRKNRLAYRCLEYISEFPERIKYHDQDTLNAVLHKEMKLLPIKYNLQTGFLLSDYTCNSNKIMKEILECIESPIIIHFTGYNKPWFRNSMQPYRKLFLKFKRISPWKKLHLINNMTFMEKIKHLVFRITIFIKKKQVYIVK